MAEQKDNLPELKVHSTFSTENAELPASEPGSDTHTFQMKTLSNQSETEQLIKEYQRLIAYIPGLDQNNDQQVEDLRVDLSILQHRIEDAIDQGKKSKESNFKNKSKYLEKVYADISEKIDSMTKAKPREDGVFGNTKDSPVTSLKEIDLDDSTSIKNSVPVKQQPQKSGATKATGPQVQEPITKRTFFVKEEKLIQAEDRQIEFKQYRYPFGKDQKAIILKTIVSMLNTIGGTIMIGVRDQDLSVAGMDIDQKQKDEIILQFMQMLQLVFPAVNEEVTVEYLPVKFKWGKWASKTWVCRIQVQQGQLDRFYIVEDASSITSFVRLQAMVKSVKLKEIINFIYERAKTPREKQPKIEYASPDQEGVKNCNLEQDAIDNLSAIDSQKIIDNKIIFTDILESTYQKLTDFLHEKLSEQEIEYQMINQRRHLLLQFQDTETTKKVTDMLNLEKDRFVYDLRHQFNFKKVILGDITKSIVVKNEYTFIIDHIDVAKREDFMTYLSDWLKSQNIKHVWLHFKLFLALYVMETEIVSKFLKTNKDEIATKFGFHQKVFFGFAKDYIIVKSIDSKVELKKKLAQLLQYVSYRALVESDGTTIHVKCKDFYDLLIAFDRIKSAYMDGQFSHFTNQNKIKVFLGFDRYIE